MVYIKIGKLITENGTAETSARLGGCFSIFAVRSGGELCHSSLARLLVYPRQVQPRLVHCLDDEIEGYFPRGGEEIRQSDGVDGPAGADRVSLDARYLHETSYRVAGETEMVLHRRLCRVLYLVYIHAEQLCKSGCRHGAGGE